MSVEIISWGAIIMGLFHGIRIMIEKSKKEKEEKEKKETEEKK